MQSLPACYEIHETIVDARDAKIRLPLERTMNVKNPESSAADKFDDGENEILRLIERVKNLISGHGNCIRAGGAAFNLDKTQLSSPGDSAFDVVAESFKFTID